MKKHTSIKKAKGGSNFADLPFSIGREGAEFLPKTFGTSRGTAPKTVAKGGKLPSKG